MILGHGGRRIVGMAAAAALLAPTCITAAPAGAADGSGLSGWLQSRFGPAHNADNPVETALTRANVSGLNQHWSVPVSRTNWVLEDNPTVLAGVAYLATWDGHLWAIDASTGSVRWSKTLKHGTFGTSPVDGTAMYTWLANGKIAAYSLRNGRQLWSVPESNGGGTPDASLTLSGGMLYGGSWLGDVFARDPSTGAQIWRRNLGSGASVFGAVVAWHNEVLAVDSNDVLHALNAGTGAVLWTRQFTFLEWDDPPAVGAGGLAFVLDHGGPSSSCTLDAVDAGTGTIRWHRSLPHNCLDAGYVALDASHVYLATDKNDFLSLDAATGRVLWRTRLPGVAFAGGYWNRPVLANGVAYVVGSYSLWAVNTSTGHVLATVATTGAFGEPVVWNGTVYTAEADDSLHAYALGPAASASGASRPVVTGGRDLDPHGLTAAVSLAEQLRSAR
jgi:outer membrane protein assembly factor BamB